MHAFPILNNADLVRAITLVDELWDAAPATAEADVRDVMAELIDRYEARELADALPPADPSAVIEAKRKELRISQRELGRRLGWGGGRVSEVLSGKRNLTLAMVRDLERVLGLDPGLLVANRAPQADGCSWVSVPADVVRAAQQAGFAGCGGLDALVVRALQDCLMPFEVTVATSTAGLAHTGRPSPVDQPNLTLAYSRNAA